MKSFRKISFSLLAALLVFSNFGGIAQAETSKAANVSDVTVSADTGEAISLYKEPSGESEILLELPNDAAVSLLAESVDESPYSLVSYYDSESEEDIEGYVLSKYIAIPAKTEEDPANQEDPSQESTDSEEPQVSDGVSQEDGVSSEEGTTEPADNAGSEDQTVSEKETETAKEEESSESVTEETVENETSKTVEMADEEETSTEKSKFSAFSASVQEFSGESMSGIALKSPTSVYEAQSTSSKKLKSYDQGSTLRYYALNSNWYVTRVYLNGIATTGYISVKDVEKLPAEQTRLKGVAKQTTPIYRKASASSGTWKSYPAGSVLVYDTFISGWYEARVYAEGDWRIGYINAAHVQNAAEDPVRLKGAAKNTTPVYHDATTSSPVWKSYPAGSILVYDTFIDGWYSARMYADGAWRTGYINAADVQNATENPVRLKGAAKKTTPVYHDAATSSPVWKSYPAGSVLVYDTFIDGWYSARMYADGAWRTGYINAADVQNATENPVRLKGVAKNTTPIYQDAATSSPVWKSYPAGSVLVYDTFIDGWYSARMYADGAWRTGYINASDVENSVQDQKSIRGIGLQSPTNLYEDASTDSSVLKSYPQGKILYYQSFVSGWYETGFYVDGKKKTAYIDASHVENILDQQDDLEGISLSDSTNVYTYASRGSSVIKSYPKGKILKFKTFSASWYEARVFVNGDPKIGYIHKDDVQTLGTDVIQEYTNYGMTFEEMLDLQMSNNPQTDLYRNEPAYIWADYVDLDTWTVTANVNVRSSMSTASSDNIVSMVKNGGWVNVVDTHGDWVEVRLTWKNAKRDDVAYYLDPSNFTFGSKEYYQFLKLSLPANLSVQEVNEKVLTGKGILDGKGQAFIDAASKYKVNEVYLISHALLETGNGTSDLANGVVYNGVKVYNMYGYGAYDSCPLTCGAQTAYEQGWFTPEKAIIGGAELISSGYIYRDGFQQDTLYKMRWNPEGYHQYATDIGWAAKQVSSIFNLYSLLDNYTLYFDQPYYEVK
ncbi:glucosaminidase domain-containing protein [Rossellomorea aquimaris]|uniref:Mannosyl-glycoprotein endo-beta-N-acetylglucosaminidase n=1 Tax=Rossellomorea aquimaris TaxID=189382 RepID=A0A1J6VP16_9BACI|nr:N-acetylglucosaminidase [Rossellomorea aquimaris]OIU67686.1 hypothetical protein BHE18_12720 [Rossellomorea aquimaris]